MTELIPAILFEATVIGYYFLIKESWILFKQIREL